MRKTVKEEFQNKWCNLEIELNSTYKNYINKNKIIILLKSWIFYNYLISKYASKDDIEKIIENNINIHYFITNVPSIKEKNKFHLDIKFLFNIINSINLRGYPTRTIRDRILNRFGAFVTNFIPLSLNNCLRLIIIEKLMNHFPDLEIFIKNLPYIFFSDQVKCKQNKIFYLTGSAHSIFDYSGYENFLLLGRKIVIYSFQHGGGYGIYVDDYYLEYEINISDKFYGWNLFENNVEIARFSRFKPKNAKISKVVWVCRPRPGELQYYVNRNLYQELVDNSPIEFLENIFINFKDVVFQKHPPYSKSNLYKLKFNEMDELKSAELIINKNDYVVFDVLSQTLLYFCIDKNIDFIVIISKKSRNFFTPQMYAWEKVLHENNKIAYIEDDITKEYLLKKLSIL